MPSPGMSIVGMPGVWWGARYSTMGISTASVRTVDMNDLRLHLTVNRDRGGKE